MKCLILAIVLWLAAAPSWSARLEGGVEHSESLDPLDTQLRPGKIFDPSSLARQPHSYEWVKIPDWLAGLWSTRFETQKNNMDLKTGFKWGQYRLTRKDKHLFGMQKDARRAVWHCVIVPRMHAVRSGNFTEYRIEVYRSFPEVTDNQVVTIYRFTGVRVANENNRIIDARQQESVMKFTARGHGRLKVLNSSKTFDFEGRPEVMSQGEMTMQRMREFKEVPVYRHKDMRQDFKAFLTSKQMQHLIPHYLKLADERKAGD